MKNIIILILFTLQIDAASIIVNFAKDENKTFSTIHLQDSKEILCRKIDLNLDKYKIKCDFFERVDQNIKKRENKHFDIFFDNKSIIIVPKFEASLYPVIEELPQNSEILKNSTTKHNHWIIVGYKNRPTMFKKNTNLGIDFPVAFYEPNLPSVGVLDLEEKPIETTVEAKRLANIKSLYQKQKYEDVIEMVDILLEDSKDKTFESELELYKLRSLDKLMFLDSQTSTYIDPYDSVDLAIQWIEQNPSNENLPEVLMYIAKSYLKLGLISKAKRYIDILKQEYSESDYYNLVQIYYADKLFTSGKQAKAIKLYKNSLYKTKKISTAAIAALKLTDRYLDIKDNKNAVIFYKKVLNAGDIFLHDNIKQNYHIAKKLANIKEYDLAIKSVKRLINLSESKSDLLESMEKDLAYWSELRGDFNSADKLYNQYLQNYKDGQYKQFVLERLEKLQINFKDNNDTKRLNYLNKMIKKYPNEPIHDKAIIQKAEILLKNRDFDGVLVLKQELNKSDIGKDILKQASIKKINKLLKDDECVSAVSLITTYNITPKEYNENKYYNCFQRVAAYQEAFDIAKKHFNDKNISNRLQWLYNGAKVSNKIGLYKNTILLSQKVENISQKLNTTKYIDIMYDKAEAYYNLKKYDDLMLKEVEKIDKVFKNSIKNIDIFDKVLRYAKNINNSSLIKKYSKKIIELQKLHNISDYSPMVEFDLMSVLKKEKNYQEALQIGLKLLYKKLNDEQKARVLYMLGELSQKLNRPKEAKEFFLKCGEIVKDSKWQKLCVENMKILSKK